MELPYCENSNVQATLVAGTLCDSAHRAARHCFADGNFNGHSNANTSIPIYKHSATQICRFIRMHMYMFADVHTDYGCGYKRLS